MADTIASLTSCGPKRGLPFLVSLLTGQDLNGTSFHGTNGTTPQGIVTVGCPASASPAIRTAASTWKSFASMALIELCSDSRHCRRLMGGSLLTKREIAPPEGRLAMAIYSIVPRSDGTGFDIEVISNDGTRHTMLGFATEAEAKEWIATDRLREINLGRPDP
jgi:hypothetical protein